MTMITSVGGCFGVKTSTELATGSIDSETNSNSKLPAFEETNIAENAHDIQFATEKEEPVARVIVESVCELMIQKLSMVAWWMDGSRQR